MLNLVSFLSIEKVIIFISAAYLTIRGCQELYELLKKKYLQDYLPLKRAFRYKKNSEIFNYHLFNYAQKLINRQQITKSKRYLQIILRTNPTYQHANYLLGIANFHEQNFREAKKYLLKESANDAQHPLIFFFLSQTYYQLNSFECALTNIEKSLKLNPYHYAAYLLAIDIFAHLEIAPEKEWLFFQQTERHQCLTRPIWQHMVKLEENFLPHSEREKRQEFYATLKNDWQKSTSLKEQSMRALAEQKLYLAASLTLEGLQINPHDNQLYQLYDQILISQKKYSDALIFYQKEHLRINLNPLEANLRLVDYLVYNKRYQEALDNLLTLYQQNENAKFLHYPICVIYNWLGESEKALDQLAQAIYYDHRVKELAFKNPDLKNLQKQAKLRQLM